MCTDLLPKIIQNAKFYLFIQWHGAINDCNSCSASQINTYIYIQTCIHYKYKLCNFSALTFNNFHFFFITCPFQNVIAYRLITSTKLCMKEIMGNKIQGLLPPCSHVSVEEREKDRLLFICFPACQTLVGKSISWGLTVSTKMMQCTVSTVNCNNYEQSQCHDFLILTPEPCLLLL